MCEKEMAARELLEKMKKPPEHAQERIGYMIEGAALVAREDEPDGKHDDPTPAA